MKGVSCSKGAFSPKLPNTLAGYRALGPRLRETGGTASDYSGEDGTHIWRVFEFIGFKVHAVFGVKAPYKGSFIETAEFSDPKWNGLTGIKIGSPISELLAQASNSVKRKTSPLLFCGALEGAPDCAKVFSKRGLVTKVQYECYTG